MRVIRLLFPPDPGALRLLAALRATLAGVLTFLLVLLLGQVTELPVTDRMLGFGIALFLAANLRDPTLRQRLVTIALTVPIAFVATLLAALLFDQPLLAAILLPLVMFAVAYGATRGPRWATIGIVALIAYFIGLVTHQPPATLPMRLIVLLLAAGNAALIRCVIMPERPRVELDRLRRAVHAGVIRVLDRIATAVAAGTWTDRTREDLHHDVYLLDEVVMAAQARAAALATELPGQPNPRAANHWLHLLTVELSIERVARVALQNLGGPADRGPLLDALTALRTGAALPSRQSDAQLAGALGLLAHVMRDAAGEAALPVAAPPPAAAVSGLRPATQTAIAAALAIVTGDLVSPNRWYWAAFAAFVMFQGTRSRIESIAKGMQFVVGTLAGVVFGVLVATLLSGHEVLTMLAIIAAVFLAFQANVAAYGMMVFWITVLLGLVFSMLGLFPPEVLLLRLKETAAGAACGVLVSTLVLVRHEHAASESATRAFLQALGRSVDGAAKALLDGTPALDQASLILTAEQRFHDLNAVTQSEQLGLAALRSESLRRRVLVLEACENWARELGQISMNSPRLQDPRQVALAREIVARIDRVLHGLTERQPDPLPAEAPVEVTDDGLPRSVRLLLRIGAALVHLASR